MRATAVTVVVANVGVANFVVFVSNKVSVPKMSSQ